MGQKGGMNVLDFRDGQSRSFFSTTAWLETIKKLPGVKSVTETAKSAVTAGNRLLKSVEIGKEYYFVSGRHAAIVRKTEEGVLQYLELQSSSRSGWTDFNGNPRYTLSTRFGDYRNSWGVESFMIDVDSFKNSDDLRHLLGYINTAEGEQRKGKYGTIK
jgi:YHS domain-containing protein